VRRARNASRNSRAAMTWERAQFHDCDDRPSRLLKKSAKGAVFDDFWEVSQKSDRKPPLKTLAFWTRCGVYAPFERAKKSYFNNLLVAPLHHWPLQGGAAYTL
jgi:hypothetical protein